MSKYSNSRFATVRLYSALEYRIKLKSYVNMNAGKVLIQNQFPQVLKLIFYAGLFQTQPMILRLPDSLV